MGNFSGVFAVKLRGCIPCCLEGAIPKKNQNPSVPRPGEDAVSPRLVDVDQVRWDFSTRWVFFSTGFRGFPGKSWKKRKGGLKSLTGCFTYFFMFTPKIGEDEPILTNIFFKWVETTN